MCRVTFCRSQSARHSARADRAGRTPAASEGNRRQDRAKAAAGATLREETVEAGTAAAAPLTAITGADGALTAEDIKKAVAAGGIEVWRGFGKRAVEHIEQFKHGEHYVSKGGVDGTGIYTTSDESETHFYTDDLSTVTHMAIKPGAKILVGELVTPQFPDMKPFTLDEKERFKMVSAKIKEYEKSFPNARTAEGKERILYSMLLDPGISGMLSGYDAIKNGDHYLVLNRAALIVEEK